MLERNSNLGKVIKMKFENTIDFSSKNLGFTDKVMEKVIKGKKEDSFDTSIEKAI